MELVLGFGGLWGREGGSGGGGGGGGGGRGEVERRGGGGGEEEERRKRKGGREKEEEEEVGRRGIGEEGNRGGMVTKSHPIHAPNTCTHTDWNPTHLCSHSNIAPDKCAHCIMELGKAI